MSIARRVEYVRWCDGYECYTCEAADWKTRKQAEEAAIKEGWKKIGSEWFCPECIQKSCEKFDP